MIVFDLTVSMDRAKARLATLPSLPLASSDVLPLAGLPEEVRTALYNLEIAESETVAAEVVAFYSFNYGSSRALSFASGLPIAALARALAMSGWRQKSRALLQAVCQFRSCEP